MASAVAGYRTRYDMENIIVVGYPKSGSTWLTRLTAELVGCPAAGFWNSDHGGIACEGSDRVSDFKCFKSHHQLHELGIKEDSDEHHIIYVIRDPRDIAISGAHYFGFEKCKNVKRIIRRMLGGIASYGRIVSLYKRTVYRLLYSDGYSTDRMIEAIIHGSEDLHYWFSVSWKSHYEPYLERGVLFVRYEDMILSPEKECKRILQYLSQKRDERYIRRAIERQSFKNRRDEFITNGETEKAALLRVGKSGQWKHRLSESQRSRFDTCLSKELQLFSY